jgi:hypothetical protein
MLPPLNIPLAELLQHTHAYKWYAAGGLKCKGDGSCALRRWANVEPELRAKLGGSHQPNDMMEIPCPCVRQQTRDCSLKAHLMLLFPKASASGVYQIDTGSVHNVRTVLGAIKNLKDQLGRISGVPLTISREPREIPYENSMKLHYLLRIDWDGSPEALARFQASPPSIMHTTIAVPTDTFAPVNPETLPVTSTRPIPVNGTGHGNGTDAGLRMASSAPTPAPEVSADAAQTASAAAADQPEAPAGGAPEPPTETLACSASTTAPIAPPASAPKTQTTETPASGPASAVPNPEHRCDCGKRVTQRIADYSTKYYGRILCMHCQRKTRKR